MADNVSVNKENVQQRVVVNSAVDLRNRISTYGKDKRENNHIVKFIMVIPPIGVVTHG